MNGAGEGNDETGISPYCLRGLVSVLCLHDCGTSAAEDGGVGVRCVLYHVDDADVVKKADELARLVGLRR